MHAQVCRPTLASKTILAFQSSNQNRGDNPMKSAWKPFVFDGYRGDRGYRGLEAFPNHPCFHVLMLWARLGGCFIIKLGMSPCEPLHFQDTSSFQPL